MLFKALQRFFRPKKASLPSSSEQTSHAAVKIYGYFCPTEVKSCGQVWPIVRSFLGYVTATDGYSTQRLLGLRRRGLREQAGVRLFDNPRLFPEMPSFFLASNGFLLELQHLPKTYREDPLLWEKLPDGKWLLALPQQQMNKILLCWTKFLLEKAHAELRVFLAAPSAKNRSKRSTAEHCALLAAGCAPDEEFHKRATITWGLAIQLSRSGERLKRLKEERIPAYPGWERSYNADLNRLRAKLQGLETVADLAH